MTDARILARHGISGPAEAAWRALLADPGKSKSELCSSAGITSGDLARHLEPLVDAHLLRIDEAVPSGFVANDPEVALEVLAVRAERRLAAEAEQVGEFRARIPELADLYAAGRARAGILPGFEILTSLSDIRRQIYLESERSADELRSLVRTTTSAGLVDSRETDQRELQRGKRMRSIVRPTDLQSPRLYEMLLWLHEHGEEVRALDAVPTQMHIFGTSLAVVRVDPDDSSRGAMFIRVRNLIELLIELYERLWGEAEPLFPDSMNEHLSPRQHRILTLVAAGAKDEAIARSLSVGVRTIRRDLSELKDLAGASSRTDLITSAMRRGWIPTPGKPTPSSGPVEAQGDHAAQLG